MSEYRADSKDSLAPSPSITPLGNWPAVEEVIRDLGREHHVPPEIIEAFLREIKAHRAKREPNHGQ